MCRQDCKAVSPSLRKGEAILGQTQVYILCIPKRRRRAEDLLSHWGFSGASFVDGVDKADVDLSACIRDGVVAKEYEEVLWEDVEYIPEGKVACHLGHLGILRAFLQDANKSYALIFEDDLEDKPSSDVMQELKAFLSKVPDNFDLLHLGFVRESRAERTPADAGGAVFRSAEALGRHAYLVTKPTARLLVKETLPMHNHGDKMFQEVYRKHGLFAYQPPEPLFHQDRVNFDSELMNGWKPSRAFQPTPEDDGVRERDRAEMQRRKHLRAQQALEADKRLELQLLELPQEEQATFRQLQAQGHSLRVLLAPRPGAVLFLGVEGVLNTEKSLAFVRGRPELHCLERLAEVVGATGASLVPTSAHCNDAKWLLRFINALERAGISRSLVAGSAAPEWPVGTGVYSDTGIQEARAHEIMTWLAQNPDVKRWAVVDCTDLGDACGGFFAGRCVRTDALQGLRSAEAGLLTAALGRPPPGPEEPGMT